MLYQTVCSEADAKVKGIIARYAKSHHATALLLEAWDRVMTHGLPLDEAIREEFTEPLASRLYKAVTSVYED